jgi:hypothetical protein
MPNEGVAAGEDQALVAVVGPAHPVRRTSVLTNFEDLGIAIEITDVMTSNDQSITLLCMHWDLQVSSPRMCMRADSVARGLSPFPVDRLTDSLTPLRPARSPGRPAERRDELGVTAGGCAQHGLTARSRVVGTERHDRLYLPMLVARCGGGDIVEKVIDNRALRGQIRNERATPFSRALSASPMGLRPS